MKPINTVKWVLMFIIVVLIATAMQGQDSVRVKITYAKHINDSTYYQVKIFGYHKINIICCCEQKHKAGDVVMTARKDLEFLPTRRIFQ